MKKWESVEEVYNHALDAVGEKVEDIIKEESVQYYYKNPKNKGWIGNKIEEDYFYIPNNNKKEADIPYLNLEIKVTPIYKTKRKKEWSSKERLTLNIFDFNDEYKRTFEQASFLEKASLMNLLFYEYEEDIPSPQFEIKAASIFDFNKLPKEDLLIIEQDWNIIVQKIKEGKAEELSDRLTTYLGATTKGAKTEENMATQPFSNVKAHRRAFTLKNSYMTQYIRRLMAEQKTKERVIKNVNSLKEQSFEQIILDTYKPFIGKTKNELAEKFNIIIPDKNDKASLFLIARKMLNVKSDIQQTEEFIKSGISVKIVTVEKANTTEHFKLTIPEETIIDPSYLVSEDWDTSILREYLLDTKFLLVVFEKKGSTIVFKGVMFWYVPYNELEEVMAKEWKEVKNTFQKGLSLTYTPTRVFNNLPNPSETKCLHVRPSADKARYYDDGKNAIKLPSPSTWINRPSKLKKKYTDYYMTKQAWWFNSNYMYEQVKDML